MEWPNLVSLFVKYPVGRRIDDNGSYLKEMAQINPVRGTGWTWGVGPDKNPLRWNAIGTRARHYRDNKTNERKSHRKKPQNCSVFIR
ncbi:hypothetical protein GWI33_012003 [Rhynchophorus ferrugineus]|uniref:Uncharacterized protein n=1 Tax=Rhynchophorus ferrugineus TaxID=354439 RepID=A0A834IQ43_RHYFE|nr:hypothetical protein GWI33_012003 [Rhynchophorus ferrugineus]